jgi:putative transposase
MYARGMTVRDIQDHLQEIYGVEVSPDLIYTVTDGVINIEVKEWQSRPLDEVYPILHLDATSVNVRSNGRVINKSAYLAIGIACVDGLKGFPEAIEAIFPKTEVQLCVVHMIRNSLWYVSWKDRKVLASDLKSVYHASSEEEAR